MADETRKLQKDPPEGSRKTVEHELERQSGQAKSGSDEQSSRRSKAERRGPERGLR
jgi:hypothetical protein